jgi:hypothetical protein
MEGPSKNTQFNSGECSTISFLDNHTSTSENILVYWEIKDFASRSFESNIQYCCLGICGKV